MMNANANAKAQAVANDMLQEQAEENRFQRDKIQQLEKDKRLNEVEIKRLTERCDELTQQLRDAVTASEMQRRHAEEELRKAKEAPVYAAKPPAKEPT